MALSVCGGIGVGAVAAGGNSTPFSGLTHTITLTRNVPCPCVINVVVGALTTGASDTSLAINSVVDSVGGTYVVSTGTKALLGLIRQEFTDGRANHRTMMIGSALRTVAAGELSSGDTITITWFSDHGAARMIAAAVALTGVGEEAVEQLGLIVYDDGASYPDQGTSTDLRYPTAFGAGFKPQSDPECAWVTGWLAYGPSFNAIPAEGVRLGDFTTSDLFDGDFEIAAGAIPETAPSTKHDPGWTWTNPATAAIVNYQTVELAESGIVFDSGWTHRIDS